MIILCPPSLTSPPARFVNSSTRRLFLVDDPHHRLAPKCGVVGAGPRRHHRDPLPRVLRTVDIRQISSTHISPGADGEETQTLAESLTHQVGCRRAPSGRARSGSDRSSDHMPYGLPAPRPSPVPSFSFPQWRHCMKRPPSSAPANCHRCKCTRQSNRLLAMTHPFLTPVCSYQSNGSTLSSVGQHVHHRDLHGNADI